MTSNERPSKRARSAAACNRCKHRKQRCDNAAPSCAACLSAGEACSYENRVYRAEYVEALEVRLADLERQLQTSQQRQGGGLDHPQHTPPTTASPGAAVTAAADTPAEQNTDEVESAFQLLSSTSYLGISSGFPLARTLQAVIGSPGILSSQATRQPGISHAKPVSPDRALSNQFINAYLCKVHVKHSFMSRRRISDLHESCETLASSARPVRRTNVSARIDYLTIHLIYAIGARYMQLSQDEYHCSSDSYYATAIQDVECLFEARTLESLEGMLLLVIHQLRSPSQPGVWTLIGMTMRHAISLGLHRRFHGPNITDQRRKRIFWTTYMLERSIARTLGLPVSISDRDIDVAFPAVVAEDIEDEEEMSTAILQNPTASATSAVVHIFRLTQLESKIYSSIYRVDRALGKDLSLKSACFRQLLEEWKSQISTAVPIPKNEEQTSPNSYVDRRYHILHYHRVMLLLLLPNLTGTASTHPDFQLCHSSAGQVAQLYKQLHSHQDMLSYSLIALHATLVAGLTLIYCFVATEGAIFSPRFSSDVRACSTVFYIISERWSAARKVRDAFERMVSLTVERKESLDIDGIGNDRTTGSLILSDVNEQTSTEMMWQELAAEMPWLSCQQDCMVTGGDIFPEPPEFWNSLGPWLDNNIDSL